MNIATYRCYQISLQKCIFTRGILEISDWRFHWFSLWHLTKIRKNVWQKLLRYILVNNWSVWVNLQPRNGVTFLRTGNDELTRYGIGRYFPLFPGTFHFPRAGTSIFAALRKPVPEKMADQDFSGNLAEVSRQRWTRAREVTAPVDLHRAARSSKLQIGW